MVSGKYTSIYEIIERVMDFFDEESLNFSSMVRHISDALLLVGAPAQFTNVVEEIPIVEYRGMLPNGLIYINQVRMCDTHEALRYTGNTFHPAINSSSPDIHSESQKTYQLNNSHIYTSFEEGTIEVAFKKMPVDEKGFPLIPDNVQYKMAMENYLMERIAFKMFLSNKLSEAKYRLIQKEREWYMGAAESKGKLPSVDKMETIKNAFSRMLTQTMAHSTFFTSVTDPETMNIQPYKRG